MKAFVQPVCQEGLQVLVQIIIKIYNGVEVGAKSYVGLKIIQKHDCSFHLRRTCSSSVEQIRFFTYSSIASKCLKEQDPVTFLEKNFACFYAVQSVQRNNEQRP